MRQINFVHEQRQSRQAFVESDRQLAKKVGYGLVAFFIIFAAIVGVSFYVESRISALNTEAAAVQAQLQKLVPFEREYGVFVKKVKVLNAMAIARKEKNEATAYFYSLIPMEYVLKDVQVNDAAKKISFGLIAQDVFRATKVVNLLYGTDLSAKNYAIKLSSMGRQSNGEYQLQGEFTYGTK